MNKNLIKLIILDRDGTINLDINGYTHDIKDCNLFEDVIKFFTRISTDIKIVVVTNQSGLARNYYSIREFNAFNEEINSIIKEKTSHPGIAEFLYCPHLPSENCRCRKPKSYLIKKAMQKYNSKTASTILIGDKKTDIQAGEDAGIRSYLIDRDRTNKLSKGSLLIKGLNEILIKRDLLIPLRVG